MKWRRATAVAHKEWREVLRDRLFFTLAFVVPAALMLIFGYGLSLDVENVPFAVVDYDRTSLSRDYAYRFIGSRYFDFKGYAASERELDPLLKDNRIRAAIIIPPHFQRNLLAGRAAHVQTLIDGTIPSRTQTTKGYVAAINSNFSMEMLAHHVSRLRGLPLDQARERVQPVRLEVRYLYNQSVKSIWSLAPKLIMLVMIFVPPLLTAVGIVREKETGSIYNIYASTVSRGEFLLGKLAPYVAISVVNVLVLWFLATQVFGAPFKGHPLFFFLASVLFVTCTTGIGLLVSLLVRTQLAATLITVILTMVPAMEYSGFLMPVESLSGEGGIEARLLPAMYYTNIVVGSFLKGVGLEVLWVDLLVLAGYTLALYVAGYLLFHKRPKT
ncbi:ABC transporter permease [Aquabacterium sp.]|uniref:ABC transporter permease n=1 Tax=Aquabacterium sp. TaxID=1872578 RepID=UPI000F9EA398|nr:MAG: ABC transporter permease [Burkholderiales bacterium]